VSRPDRFGRILELLARDGSVSVGALAADLGVSEATVRRDLQILGDQRLLERSHGGAIAHGTAHELPVRYRTGRSDEKQRIAHAAAELVEEGTAVGLTGGTTTTEVARALATRQELTVVTNALNIATELASNPRLRVFAAGGEVRGSSREAVGPSAEAFVAGYNIDVAFLGVDGVDAKAGCTNYDPVGARVNAMLRERARVTAVLADATKITRVALAPVCGMSEVDVLITDSRADPAAVEAIRSRGCEVLCV
jgi:DeoR family transcriptional regulator, aga operon transcriptional repressor